MYMGKNIVYILCTGFGTIHTFWHPLGGGGSLGKHPQWIKGVAIVI